jgi:hypothetical protein
MATENNVIKSLEDLRIGDITSGIMPFSEDDLGGAVESFFCRIKKINEDGIIVHGPEGEMEIRNIDNLAFYRHSEEGIEILYGKKIAEEIISQTSQTTSDYVLPYGGQNRGGRVMRFEI